MKADAYLCEAKRFAQMPYSQPPFNGRSWGDSMHSLCSYQGKLKPSIAHFLISHFTSEGEVVLDPFSGSGTIPLEARLQGRYALANDLQELAYILSLAKVYTPDAEAIHEAAEKFLIYCKTQSVDAIELEEASTFGLNGVISDYFHPDNLNEVINARRYIKDSIDSLTAADALVFSSFLHILHGNRPYALSRTSHPVTPLKPRGEFEYRELRTRLLAKVERTIGASQLPLNLGAASHQDGKSYWSDFKLLTFASEVDAIITSPPFAGSTRFHSSNWMRLWATGWGPSDFTSKRSHFLEEKQKSGLAIYSEFFEVASRWLKPGGKLIMHLGKTSKIDMRKELSGLAEKEFEVIYGFDESVVGAEKFGIRDQGATKYHQFLFLRKSE